MALKAILAVIILSILNGYVAIRIVNRWPGADQHVRAIVIVGVALFALQLLAPFGDRLFFPALMENYSFGKLVASIANWLSYLALGMMSCLFLYMIIADVITIIWVMVAVNPPVDLERRTLLSLGMVTAGTTLIGVGQVLAGPEVRHVDIPLAGLPKAFDGFTIAQISDLHAGPTIGKAYVERVVAITNDLKPDLITLTGDFVDGSVEDLKDDVAPLATLDAPHGKFYITGNHEYYWGAEAWIAEFAKLGAQPLINEHTVLQRDGQSVILAGVSDYSTRSLPEEHNHAFNPQRALDGAPSGLVKILLAHQPASYEAAHKAGYDLQLSGHTHAGQYFPFTLLIGFFQRYYKGLNRHENMWVYVNSGTGYWGPPLRTGVPSEITLITLRVA